MSQALYDACDKAARQLAEIGKVLDTQAAIMYLADGTARIKLEILIKLNSDHKIPPIKYDLKKIAKKIEPDIPW